MTPGVHGRAGAQQFGNAARTVEPSRVEQRAYPLWGPLASIARAASALGPRERRSTAGLSRTTPTPPRAQSALAGELEVLCQSSTSPHATAASTPGGCSCSAAKYAMEPGSTAPTAKRWSTSEDASLMKLSPSSTATSRLGSRVCFRIAAAATAPGDATLAPSATAVHQGSADPSHLATPATAMAVKNTGPRSPGAGLGVGWRGTPAVRCGRRSPSGTAAGTARLRGPGPAPQRQRRARRRARRQPSPASPPTEAAVGSDGVRLLRPTRHRDVLRARQSYVNAPKDKSCGRRFSLSASGR